MYSGTHSDTVAKCVTVKTPAETLKDMYVSGL